jgi:hypothetical protein
MRKLNSAFFNTLLGFKVIRDLNEVGSEKLSRGLRIPDGRGRAVLMILGDNPRSTRLDLIEWKNPKTEGQPHPHLWHAGMCRLALRTRTLEKDYQELRSKGIEFWTEPIMFEPRTKPRADAHLLCHLLTSANPVSQVLHRTIAHEVRERLCFRESCL